MKSATQHLIESSVSTLLEEATRALAPFGIEITIRHEPWNKWIIARLKKKVDAPGHIWHNQVVSVERALTDQDLLYRGAGVTGLLQHFLREITEDVLITFMRHFRQVPQASEPPDWRPQEMMPEDFYAM